MTIRSAWGLLAGGVALAAFGFAPGAGGGDSLPVRENIGTVDAGAAGPEKAAAIRSVNLLRRTSRRVTPQTMIRRSTPAAEGLDAEVLAGAYQKAAAIPHMYSMLVIRNRAIVAEEYFEGRTGTTPEPVASVGKSILGALVGIAYRDGYLPDLDQRMIDFFPEYDIDSLDPRKRDITIRHLLEMRAGYPFDSSTEYFNQLSRSYDWMRFIIVSWALETEPGTAWNYSSASSHLLGGILTKATGLSLRDFANQHLFGPMGLEIGYWPRDRQGYCVGHGDVELSPLQLASFGQMMLDHGRWRGRQIVPSWWIKRSFADYSDTWYGNDIWPYRDISYGYLWWHADVDDHHVYFAWGHGGQFITVVPSLDMVVVTTAYNFVGDFTDNSWDTEGAIFRLIATDVLPAAF